ncbi:major facilitator superfamily domain-containing protein [Pilaira anomala]|nr:major facilitator superfamily domain-containing protein [Pilaira anomala]
MVHRNQPLPDVYDQPHLFDPPSDLNRDEDTEPMLNTTNLHKTYIRGANNTLKIIFLTLCLAGLQFTWTVEMAYGTPYLLSLGLTKSYMSLVWIAGPLSGLIMQPVVGVLSDSCKSKWGRRRPFLVGGSLIMIISLLAIGWTREITSFFTRSESGDTFATVSIIIAIGSIYILDFSVNCVQASCRALIVDSLPTSQQEEGTAWAGRMVGLGNVAGYFMGYADLVRVFPFFGDTQLKVLCVFATIVLLLCDFITCYSVREKPFEEEYERSKSSGSTLRLFSDIFRNIWNLPKPIQEICNVQFFAWIGWFPFLFYSTTWVAEIYNETQLDESSPVADKVGQATRAGSFAFLVYSLVSLASSFIIPLFVSSSDTRNDATSNAFTLRFGKQEYKITFLNYLKVPFLTLPRAWTMSHFIFCICMLSTILVSDVVAAAVVIGLCGISWAISMWAPFSLLGEYISHQEAISQRTRDHSFVHHSQMMASNLSVGVVGTEPNLYQQSTTQDDSDDEAIEMLRVKESRRIGQGEGSGSTDQNEGNEDEEQLLPENSNDLSSSSSSPPPAAGVLLGIHNMYIVLPQFLVTFLSSFIFKLLEQRPELNETPPDGIGLILRIGAVMAGIAGFISLKIGKDL